MVEDLFELMNAMMVNAHTMTKETARLGPLLVAVADRMAAICAQMDPVHGGPAENVRLCREFLQAVRELSETNLALSQAQRRAVDRGEPLCDRMLRALE